MTNILTDYDKYWNSKGEYGKERVRRKNIRKEKRILYRKEVAKRRPIIGRCDYDPNKVCDGCMDC